MTPKRPYFLRAFHEWLSDNELTPYLMVDARHPDIIAPLEYAQDGKLVLNASYSATKDFLVDNEAVSFSARFGGVSRQLWLPIACVEGIYAKENVSCGFFFDPAEYPAPSVDDTKSPKQSASHPSPKKSNSPFKVIK